MIVFHPLDTSIPYNQPKFCPAVAWDPDAITYANSTTVGQVPSAIFVDIDDTAYIATQNPTLVLVWSRGNVAPISINASSLSSPYALFATVNDEIYINSATNNNGVDKWIFNTTNRTSSVDLGAPCTGLFIGPNSTIYCSQGNWSRVIAKSLNNSANTISVVAGNNASGSGSYTLSNPQGIFVDANSSLYVADMNNDRVQRFQIGQKNGTTVAGNGSYWPVSLDQPTGVVLDGNGYLFIADSGHHRIVGSGPNGFQCIAGCSETAGSGSDQLNFPRSLSFDSRGNIFVIDTNNSRVQKFILATQSCSEY